MVDTAPRGVMSLAFYLPQFHPIPENDAGGGRASPSGSTSRRPQPHFAGHDSRTSRASSATTTCVPTTSASAGGPRAPRRHRRLLLLPLLVRRTTAARRPLETHACIRHDRDFPFCLCWANENWTRRWDGRHGEVLIDQTYSAEDDERHLQLLLRIWEDERYLRIDRRPVMLVYRDR